MAACRMISLVMTSFVKNRIYALQLMKFSTNEKCKKYRECINLRWHIPVVLLNANECCNQSTQHYIQEE
jgi:hypothetical protein